MLQAVKGNKVYDVDESQAAEYAARGYDVMDGHKVVIHAAGKAVPWAKYEAALAEVDALKRKLADLAEEADGLRAQLARKRAKKAE